MLPVSNEYAQNILADNRDMPYRVAINGVMLDQTQIPNMTLNESMSGGNGIALGTANSAELSLTIREPMIGNFNGMLVEPESGLVLPDGSTEWIPLGKFWVTKTSTNNDYKTVKLSCSDGMYHLSSKYVSQLTYPAHIQDVVREIVYQANVEFIEPEVWPDLMVRVRPEGLSLRNAIGYAAGCCGCNARFNRYGQLELVWYQDTGVVIERGSQYMDGMTKLHDKPLAVDFAITGEVEKYKVIINEIDEKAGRITADDYSPLEGDYIFLTVNLNENYQLDRIEARTRIGTPVELTKVGGRVTKYRFVQPDSDVIVTAYPVWLNPDNLYYVHGDSIGNGSLSITLGPHGSSAMGPLFAEAEMVVLNPSAAEGYKLSYFETNPHVDVQFSHTDTQGFDYYAFRMPSFNVDVVAYFVPLGSEVMMMSRRSSAANVDPVTLTYTNPMIHEKMIPAIQGAVRGITYTPAKVKHRGNPAFQAGDIITVPDGDGVEHKVLIMQQTMSFGGGMNSEVTCPGQTADTANFNANGPLTTQIQQEVGKSNKALESKIKSQYDRKFEDATFSIEAEIAGLGATIDGLFTSVHDVEARIHNIETNMVTPTAFKTLQNTVTEQGKSITSLTDRVEKLEPLEEACEALGLTIVDLDDRVKALEDGTDPETDTRIELVEASVTDLKARVKTVETGLSDETAARKEAIAAIKQVPDGGTAGQVLMQTESGVAEWKTVEQKRTTGLNFSQWDNGHFSEIVDGDDTEHVYSVTFDAEGRPVTITDESGHELSITW